MKKRHAVVPFLLFAAAVGCGRGSGCVSGEKAYESLDGKVKVELVRKVRWTGGKIPGPMTDFVIRVHTTPPFDTDVKCDHVDLAEDDEGKSIAFRCKGLPNWNVIRLRDDQERLQECGAALGEREADFAKLEPLATAMDRIADCTIRSGDREPKSDLTVVTRAVAKDVGEEASALFVARLASRPEDEAFWDPPFFALTDAARARVAGELCPSIVDAGVPAPRWVRAVRTCPLDRAEVASAATERLKTSYAAKEAPLPGSYEDQALAWAAWLSPAGDVGCDALATLGPEDKRRWSALGLVGRTKTKCPAAVREKLPEPCGFSIMCDGGLCDEPRVAAKIAAEGDAARGLDAGLRTTDVKPPDGHVAQLSTLYAQGPLPRDIGRRNARLAYRITPEDGPNCGDGIPTGTPCVCGMGFPVESTVCRLPFDGGAADGTVCAVRANDEKKAIEVSKNCGTLFHSCSETTCCPGYRCEDAKDSGYPSCAKDVGERDR